MIFEKLADYLQLQIPSLVQGRVLFINQVPADSKFCALFRDGPGGFSINGYIPTERYGQFTFVVRGENHADTIDIMKQVSDALTLNGVLLDGYMVKICRPISEPISYKLSVGNLNEISVNFSINYGIVEK